MNPVCPASPSWGASSRGNSEVAAPAGRSLARVLSVALASGILVAALSICLPAVMPENLLGGIDPATLDFLLDAAPAPVA